jgi:hypothetical protein
MASSQLENWGAVTFAKVLATPVFAVILCASPAICAQNYAHPSKPKEPVADTTQTSVANTDPSRTTETHESSGNKTVDKQRVDTRGANGEYVPTAETETETVQVDATTTRKVVRTYQWDVNGNRNLAQVTEEDARSSASGDAHVVSTTSSADAAGNIHVMAREVADTKKSGPDVQETKTTLYVLDGNGGLAPSVQTQELQKSNADHTIEVTKTTLAPTSTDHWEVSEVKKSTITDDGKTRISDERISKSDSEGRLSEVSRTVGRETENAAGKKNYTVETYSTELPGITSDGGLHLSRVVTTVQNKDSGGTDGEQQVLQPKAGDPLSGLQVTARTKYTVQYGGSVEQQAKATQERDVNGNFNTVAVQTQKSEQAPAAQGQTAPAPSDKPK